MPVNKKISDNYNADSIEVIEGLSHVRRRPGMYIGSVGSLGLHHLIWEIIDNSIDEATNGFASKINVTLNTDGSVTISDNGRGIPIDLHKIKKIPAARLVFEVLGAGGKFNNNFYKTSGGLHGVGASVVNALSEWLEVEIKKDKKIYTLKYKQGKLIQDLTLIGKTNETGTKVSFSPDKTIFETVEFSYDTLRSRLRELAFLNKGVTIELEQDKKETFCFAGGLLEFIGFVNANKETIAQPLYIKEIQNDVIVEFVMQYTKDCGESVYSFVNNIATTEGGTHDAGLRLGTTRALNDFIKNLNSQKQRNKKEISLQGQDVADGLTAILSIKITDAQFEGQTKMKLGNPEVKGLVHNIIHEGLLNFLKANKKASKDILDRVMFSYEVREGAKIARDIMRKKNKIASGVPFSAINRLACCSSQNFAEREIFIVEGESAGGSAKQGRDRKTQAILPLKGKPLNVEKKNVKDILENEEMVNLIRCLGGSIGDEFNIKGIKYSKIIIATDADVDGSHIRLILLTFFYRYMRPLIDEGMIYIANPPLYRIYTAKTTEYVYSDKELEKAKQKIGKVYNLQRYKGLGEMNPEQLWETAMNPDKRILTRVKIDDAIKADALFNVFMGTGAESRREYLREHL